MRLVHLSVAAATLVTAACPGPGVTDQQGISTGGGGSGDVDVLVFTQQPSFATAGEIITPAIQVVVRDTLGVPDSAFARSITIALGSNPVGGILSGTRSVTFTARATDVESVTSATFNIVVAATR